MAAGKHCYLLMVPEGELLIISAILEVKPTQILAQTALILTSSLSLPSGLLGLRPFTTHMFIHVKLSHQRDIGSLLEQCRER